MREPYFRIAGVNGRRGMSECKHRTITSAAFSTCIGCGSKAQEIINKQEERIAALEAEREGVRQAFGIGKNRLINLCC